MTPARRRNLLLAAVEFFFRTDRSWIPDAILATLDDGEPAPGVAEYTTLINELRTADLVLLTEDPSRHWAVLYKLGDGQGTCRVTCREGEVRASVASLLQQEGKYDPDTMTLEIVEHLDEVLEEDHSRQLRGES